MRDIVLPFLPDWNKLSLFFAWRSNFYMCDRDLTCCDPDALLSRIDRRVRAHKKMTAGAETDGEDSWGYCIHVFSLVSASILVNKSKLTLTSWHGRTCLYAVFPRLCCSSRRGVRAQHPGGSGKHSLSCSS